MKIFVGLVSGLALLGLTTAAAAAAVADSLEEELNDSEVVEGWC